jgi:hypothetical protein
MNAFSMYCRMSDVFPVCVRPQTITLYFVSYRAVMWSAGLCVIKKCGAFCGMTHFTLLSETAAVQISEPKTVLRALREIGAIEGAMAMQYQKT